MYLSSLAPGEVETRDSTQYVGEPLCQCMHSACRHDANSEEMEKLRPRNLYESYKQGYLSNYSSGIRLLRVPVQIGPKNVAACKKSYDFWEARVQHPTALGLN